MPTAANELSIRGIPNREVCTAPKGIELRASSWVEGH